LWKDAVEMAGGTISLRSGEWTWHTMELLDGETQEIRQVHFWFHLEGAEGSRMHLTLGPGGRTIEEKLLALWARHPREREILDLSGMKWRFIQLLRSPLELAVSKDYQGEPYSVIFHSLDGLHGVGELPRDCGLGEATDEELLSLIRDAV